MTSARMLWTAARVLGFLALAAFGAGLPGPASAQSDRLQHDPFARPALGKLQQGARVAHGKPREGGPAPTRRLNLHAVIVAGADSIANVDGTMVRIGERIHGYRLVSVNERTAIFEKDNRQFTVSMGSDARVAQAPGNQRDRIVPAEAARTVPDARTESQ